MISIWHPTVGPVFTEHSHIIHDMYVYSIIPKGIRIRISELSELFELCMISGVHHTHTGPFKQAKLKSTQGVPHTPLSYAQMALVIWSFPFKASYKRQNTQNRE